VSTNNAIDLMIDNAAAWDALHRAVAGAKKELALQLFFWDLGYVYLTFSPDPKPGTPTVGTRLEDDLVSANHSGVAVRVLIRDASFGAVPLPYPIDTATPVVAYFAGIAPPTGIEVRRYKTDVRLPMHAKFVVIDGNEAHLVNSPIIQEYFDGAEHLVKEARRGPLTAVGEEIYGALAQLFSYSLSGAAMVQQYKKNGIRVPVHDVGVRIRGGAVKDLYDTFFLHWNVAGPAASSTLVPSPPSPPVSTVQIVRSLTRATFPGLPEGEASILESYLRGFAQAADFIYLENQYFTEHRIADAIRLALRQSKDQSKNLQVIMLMNHKVDIPGYQAWQERLMIQLQADLTQDGTIDHFGAFTLWSHDDSVTPTRIISTYVHAKVGIADDHWATVGSANLDGVSLMTGEWAPSVTWVPGMENRRETDVNMTVVDGLDGAGPSTVPGDLRRALWAEHLGLSGPTDAMLATRPSTGGWLSLWKSRAAAKLAGLTAATPTKHLCRALEWRPSEDPAKYLKLLGVDVRKLTVMEEFPGYDFNAEKWQ
jgi:phosphatidylserine/phosphatidylglycerophosphate/cardiolipin synthase-like enzyme